MNRVLWVLKFLVLGILVMVVIGLVTQGLWNWLVPVLFAGPVITFWQALGLLLLSKILFSGFHKSGHRGQHKPGWGYYWTQKWKGMSPEEREKLKQKMKEKWCYPESKPKESSDTISQ